LEWLDTERAAILAVLRAATVHELYSLVWPLAEAFTVLFFHHRYLGAWKESLELGADAAAQAAARADAAEDVALAAAAEARLRSLLSRPLLDLGDTGGAGRELRRAEALAAVSGNLHVHASVLEFLGRYQTRFELLGAADTLRRCLELNERAGDPRGTALALFFLGCAQDAEGDRTGATATLRRARRSFAELAESDPRMAARVSAAIGVVHFHLGENETAVRELSAAVRALEENNAGHYAAEALEQLARVTESVEGRTDQVRTYVRRAREIYAAVGNDRAEAMDRWLETLED
jgi:tetratricopeptide (TPR) repeat protein